jgi:Cytosolic domain of 10TM putative phosphate transporter
VCAEQVVKEEFDELYPGEVEAVHLVRNTRDLDPKVAEYKKLSEELTDLIDDYTSKRRRHKQIKRKKAR